MRFNHLKSHQYVLVINIVTVTRFCHNLELTFVSQYLYQFKDRIHFPCGLPLALEYKGRTNDGTACCRSITVINSDVYPADRALPPNNLALHFSNQYLQTQSVEQDLLNNNSFFIKRGVKKHKLHQTYHHRNQ
jgi:hypothetical protein